MKTPFFYILVIALAVGCSKTDNTVITTPVINTVIDSLPNTVGDTWTYQVDDTTFNFFGPGVPSQYNMTVTVTGTTLLPGNINATVWIYTYPSGRDTNYVFKKGDTTCFAVRQTAVYYDIVRQYVFPLQLQQSWPYTPISLHKVTVDSVATIMVGPYNFENALRTYGFPGFPDNFFIINEWVADKVGVIKRYYTTHNQTINPFQRSIAWTLLSYRLQ